MKMKWLILGLLFAAAIITVVIGKEARDFRDRAKENNKPAPVVLATSTTPGVMYLPYGKVALKVGETANFSGGSIKLLRVFDDSRCPTGVTCIWAGTVNVEIESFDGATTTRQTLALGKAFKTKNQNISFISATPYPKQDVTISEKDYVVTLDVSKVVEPVVTQPVAGKCYVGGCSSEICSDRPDAVSNCMYRPDFACYQKAKCERQTDGKCGWTQTKELKVCLQTATL
jgi:hypothetical protein